MRKKTYEIDMCHGPLLGKILIFAIPLMLSGILQLLFNAADIIVVGQYVGKESLAAVGSTSSLINLLINVFVGLSVGTNVLVARYYGAKNEKAVSETIHTAILTSLLSGIFLAFVGTFLAKPLLTLMGTPDDVLNKAALYMRIYFIGMPVIMLYNFGSSILRALGDTKRPLYFLGAAGLINVVLNLCFVIIFKMGVAGVALATILSQCISAYLIIRCLMQQTNCFKLELKRLRIEPHQLLKMLQIGLPAGIQGAIFSISNVLIQSSINSFGSVAMAGSTASSNIEGFIYTAMNSFYQAALTFTGQNLGGKQYHRLNRILYICLACVTTTGLCLGGGAYLIGHVLLGIYSPDPNVINFGLQRMQIICITYCLCGIMDVLVGSLRGLGYSILPMIVSLLGACGLRILWIMTIFKAHPSLTVLYISYPISWLITALAHIVCFVIVRHHLSQKIHHQQVQTL